MYKTKIEKKIMKKQYIKKSGNLFICIILCISTFNNCFGKFALSRKLYRFNDSVKTQGQILLTRLIKTVVMWFFIIPTFPIYGLTLFVDAFFINVIEFWTGKNLIGFNEYDNTGTFVKNFQNKGTSIQLTYLNFGEKLRVDFHNQGQVSSYILFRNQPGKIFVQKNNKLSLIDLNSTQVGSRLIVKIAMEGKLISSKIVKVHDYNELEKKYKDFQLKYTQ